MCGIVGLISRTKKNLETAEDILRDSIYFNRLRGVDSLGTLLVTKSPKPTYRHERKVGDPLLVMNKDWRIKDMIGDAKKAQFFVAHNRHATKGSKDDPAAAHPHVAAKKDGSEIVLMHNGTIWTFNGKAGEYKGVSDSAIVAKLLADEMPLGEIDRDTYGAYSYVWYDSSDNTLHFWRNKDRPMWFVETLDHTFFGSEIHTIIAACERHNEPVDIETIKELKVGTHAIYYGNDQKWMVRQVKTAEHKLGFSTFVPAEKKDPYERGKDCVDTTKILDAEELESPKAVGGPRSSNSVLPYYQPRSTHKTTATGGVENTLSTSGLYKKLTKKIRFQKVEEFEDYIPGSMITFSMDECTFTKRVGHARVTGVGVELAYPQKLNQNIVVEGGMYIPENSSGQRIINRARFYSATVTSILINKKNPKFAKFQVKDVEVSDISDSFSTIHVIPAKSTQLALPAAVVTPAKAISANDPATKAVTQEEVEVAKSNVVNIDSGVLLKSVKACNDCGEVFPAQRELKNFTNLAWKPDGIILSLCRHCLPLVVSDPDRLVALVNREKRHLEERKKAV